MVCPLTVVLSQIFFNLTALFSYPAFFCLLIAPLDLVVHFLFFPRNLFPPTKRNHQLVMDIVLQSVTLLTLSSHHEHCERFYPPSPPLPPPRHPNYRDWCCMTFSADTSPDRQHCGCNISADALVQPSPASSRRFNGSERAVSQATDESKMNSASCSKLHIIRQ